MGPSGVPMTSPELAASQTGSPAALSAQSPRPVVLTDDHSPATRVASPAQRRLALVACMVIGLVTVSLIPEARTTWGRVQAFLPAYQTAIILAYALTGYLMYGHYTATHARALLYLSGGFFYTAGIVCAQFMAFPGMFMAEGRLIGGPQTATWLWCLWHIGPVAGIFLYATSSHSDDVTQNDSGLAVRFAAVVLGLLAVSVAAVTVFHDFLPVLDDNGDYHRITTSGIAPAIQLAIGVTLFMLWRTGKFRTELNLWLAVALVALVFDDTITMVGSTRLSAGWYVGRFNALVSAGVILMVYVHELTRVYQKVAADARRLAVSNSQLETEVGQARLDALTGLPGRGLFIELANQLGGREHARGHAMALLFIDLDGFKAVNDARGHAVGDQVLVQTAQALRSVVRDGDAVGRLGGDEFVIAVAAAADQIDATAARIAGQVIEAVRGLQQGVGCSVGISRTDHIRPRVESLLTEADAAMYAAKRGGKNRFQMAGPPQVQTA